MPAAQAATICRVLAGTGDFSAMAATDPPNSTASAVSGLRRSRSAEASRAQPSTGNAHTIIGASSLLGHGSRQ